MSLYVLSLPGFPGLMSGWVISGAAPVATLKAEANAVQVDLQLATADALDVQVTITDGTSPVVATIVAGQRSISVSVAATWPADAVLTATVDTGSSGISLTGSVWLEATTVATLDAGLITLTEAKTRLGITGATAAQDTYLQAQIDAISARVRDRCGHHITERNYRDTWYKPTRAITTAPGITSVALVTQDGNSIDPSTGIVIDREVGRIWKLESIALDWAGTNALIVEYTAGSATCPPDIREAILTALTKKWASFESTGEIPEEQGQIRKQVWADVGSIEYAAGLGLDGAGGSGYDYVAGFPLGVVDQHRRYPLGYGEPTTTQVWEFLA